MDYQKAVTLNINYFQGLQLQKTLTRDIEELKNLMGNEKHMADMDALNPNIRSNNEFSLECKEDMLNQVNAILEIL